MRNPERATRALEVHSHAIAAYFVAEVLDQQPAEVARFMLDTSVLGDLTADACMAVTGRQDAAALLRGIDAANLFVVALDEERTTFRYHHLVRQLLRAELRARDPAREQELQLRAAEWYQATGDARRASRYFLAARQADRALALLQERVVADFLRDPAQPPPLDLSMVDPSVLASAPDRLLALAADLLISGDITRGGEYLDLLERGRPSIPPDSKLAARFAALRSVRYGETGRLAEAVDQALTARAIQEQAQLTDEWVAAFLPLARSYVIQRIRMPAVTWANDRRDKSAFWLHAVIRRGIWPSVDDRLGITSRASADSSGYIFAAQRRVSAAHIPFSCNMPT